MSSKKITELPQATNIANTDLLVVVTNPTTAPSTRKITFSDIMMTGSPVKLPAFTVATLPNANTFTQCIVYVSNGLNNKRLAISDGSNWRWPDGGLVS